MNKIISFVMVGTNDLEKSSKFYDAVLVHLGMKRVTIEIFIYSILITLTVILFWWFSTLGLVFLVLSTINGLIYSGFCYKLLINKDRISARKSYLYSLLYLALIFLFIIIDTLI